VIHFTLASSRPIFHINEELLPKNVVVLVTNMKEGVDFFILSSGTSGFFVTPFQE